jgi:hypothetical protein
VARTSCERNRRWLSWDNLSEADTQLIEFEYKPGDTAGELKRAALRTWPAAQVSQIFSVTVSSNETQRILI